MMLWKLFHFIFGWDYVQWENCADSGVARVHIDENGIAYYWRYKLTKVIDRIETKNQVVWLTCPSSKYLGTYL